ncbi:hypothetical protein PV433_02930 [Paenibacillus sp. GYB004]|uniref:hypothetical protein n=1 Tax=Paenibacillus sp. GYB004 TaxID=2994393 RepID=UPI002F9622F5
MERKDATAPGSAEGKVPGLRHSVSRRAMLGVIGAGGLTALGTMYGGRVYEAYAAENNGGCAEPCPAPIASIAALRLYGGVQDGQIVEVISYYDDWAAGVRGPQGGGLFVRVTDGSLADNGGTIIAVTGGGNTRWLRKDVTVLDPVDFGARADGATNDRASIASAIAVLGDAFRVLDFHGRTYYIGEIAVNEQPVFTVAGKDGIRIQGMPTMLVTNRLTGNLHYSPVFEFVDCNDLYAECHAVGDVFNPQSPYSNGPVAVQLKSSAKSVCGARIEAKVTRGLAALQTVRMTNRNARRQPADPTWTMIDYNVESVDAEYGVRFIASGDDAHGVIRTDRVARSYFIVGVSNHTAIVNSVRQRYFMDVLIKAYYDGVSNVHVIMNQRSSEGAEWPVCIEHQNDTDDTAIRNITIDLNIMDRKNPRAYASELVSIGRSITLGGTVRQSTQCVTDAITIRGAIRQQTGVNLLILPTRSNTGGILYLEPYTAIPDTKGFTLTRGGSRMGKMRGNLEAAPVKLSMDHLYPDGITLVVDTFMNADFTDMSGAASWRVREHVLLSLVSDGSGVVSDIYRIFSRLRGTAAPTITYSVAGGQLFVQGSAYTGSNAEMTVKAEIIGGRTI